MKIGSSVLALAACALLSSPLAALPQHPSPQERSPGVRRTVYVLEVDLVHARALDWAAEGASDDQVVAGAEQIVRRRLLAMERSFELLIDQDRDRIQLSMPQIQPRDRELFADMLRSLGSCEFLFIADQELASGLGIDLAAERKKLETWRAANPDAPLELFHVLDPQAGPHPRLLWVDSGSASGSGTVMQGQPEPLLLPDQPEVHFGSGSFARSYASQDQFGLPALGFELRESRGGDFERCTEARIDHRLGIVIEGHLRSAPVLMTKLRGSGIIEGRFGVQEIENLAKAFGEGKGPLRVLEVR